MHGHGWSAFAEISSNRDAIPAITVIIRKNACKKSFQRNKIKRVLREMFAKKNNLQALKGFMIAIVWGSSRIPKSQDIDEIFKKISELSS